jgi:hypothetical protein
MSKQKIITSAWEKVWLGKQCQNRWVVNETWVRGVTKAQYPELSELSDEGFTTANLNKAITSIDMLTINDFRGTSQGIVLITDRD